PPFVGVGFPEGKRGGGPCGSPGISVRRWWGSRRGSQAPPHTVDQAVRHAEERQVLVGVEASRVGAGEVAGRARGSAAGVAGLRQLVVQRVHLDSSSLV